MDINKIFQSKAFAGFIIGIGIFLVLVVVFKIGMFVGEKKSDFFCKWGDNYHMNFGGPKKGFIGEFGDKSFMGAHGIFGQIIKIDGLTLTIKGPDNVEKVIIADDNTSIKKQNDNIKAADIKVDNFITVIGDPTDNGQTKAKFIRVMPGVMPRR